ncbi:hypothetical protein BDV93DRAFT_610189 [Ceratobasidium sp. AG-I]|nr:hypothetical protein BDV93DRAFT_610189 [Ceratobasidium sp. AG-I]
MQSEDIHPHSVSSSFLVEALQEWKHARASFSIALQILSKATAALDIACDRSSSIPALKHVATSIDQDKESFAHDEHRLLSTRAMSLKVRNRYVAPINLILPPELLCRIFSLLSSTYKSPEENHDYPIILASVCNLWRRLAIDTRLLWSHIVFCRKDEDSSLVNPLRKAGLYLDRARGAPLHLDFDNRWEMFDDEQADAISLFASHMTYLHSLNYFMGDTDYVCVIIACWLEHGTPGTLTRLSVESLGSARNAQLCLPQDASTSYPRIDEFLAPIRSLSLSAVRMDWNGPAVSGLIELDLSYVRSTGSPTGAQLAGILTASPLLQSIRLCSVSIRSSQSTQLVPVKLLHLRKLFITDLKSASFERLFSVLLPSSNSLDLHLSMHSSASANLFDAVTALMCNRWRQVRIRALHLDHDNPLDLSLQQLLATFQSIDTLFLKSFTLSETLLRALARRALGSVTQISSKLHIVELDQCYIKSEGGFRDMIAAHPIQKLTLVGCATQESDGWEDVTEVKELCDWLASAVPDLRIED